MRISDLPIDRPIATVMLLTSVTVLGFVALFRLPLESFPLIEPPRVRVEVPFPGSHPLETLREVIQPLEEEIAAIPGVRSIRSDAEPGEARVRAEFDWSDDFDLKKMEVREAVERVRPRLPAGVGSIRVQSFQEGPASGAILEGRISAPRDLSESWDLLDRRIRRPLERIKGVARVDLGGVERRQVRVEVHPEALRRHGVQASDVLAALEAANVDMDLGAIRGDVLRYDVRSTGRFRSVAEIREIPLGRGQGVRIRDVASVELREPEMEYGRHLNRDFAISIEVFKEPTSNTVETVDDLMEQIAAIERDPELKGITLLVWFNAGEEIRRSLNGLRNAGVYGGLLAILVLYFFLRRVRTTLIVAVAIPFSLLVTCGAMFALGQQLNVLSMLGLMLGVGMLVDNAVVVMENIYRRQAQGMEAAEAARVGAREVFLAVLASTATTVIVWSWLFVSETNEMTLIMGEMALTICLAVGCSLLISVTFIPMAAARFVPRKEIREGFLLRRLVPGYRSVLAWTLRHRFSTLIGLMVLAGSAAFPISRVEKTGEPRFKDRAVSIRYNAYDQVTKEQMENHVNVVEEWLFTRKEELGFESVYSYFQDRGFAQTGVYLPFDRSNEKDLSRVREMLRESLPAIAGVKLEVGERMWGGHRRDARRHVSVALHGEDPEFLRELAADVEERLRGIPDSKEVYGPTLRGQQEARIVVDIEKARALGLTPRAIAEAAAFAYRGRHLRRYQGHEGETELVLSLPDALQPGIASLADLPVPRPAGPPVPLGSVARVEIARTDQSIEREDRRTTTWVSVEFDPGITTEQGQERVAARLKGLTLPEGYSWSWGAWGRDRDEGLDQMMRGVTISLLVVILLMAALFESFTQPLAIIITLPLAFFGGFWTLWLFGYDLDVVAFIGLIILIGIVVNNGIVMVDHVNNLRREGKERVAALLTGCGDRLRPVLMTAITTICGLLPLAITRPTVAGVYIDSLAVMVLGGLATSTIFTLLALPVWYSTLEDLGSVIARALPKRSGRGRLPAPSGGVLAGD